ncbi:tail fiber assembly protein, partial [Salmonella enterica subsp. enterica serovar Virginia]|nr:tail fiber assembly protein [Salmonella enterica subsp. enterica serovar Virginia]
VAQAESRKAELLAGAESVIAPLARAVKLKIATDEEIKRLDACHPAWHLLMQGLCANRVHNLAWEEEARAGSFVARAARFVLHAQ